MKPYGAKRPQWVKLFRILIHHTIYSGIPSLNQLIPHHDDVIKWKHFPRYWPFVRGIHRSPVNSPHKGQWRGALMFSLICVWINGWVNNREAGGLRRYCAHYDVIVMRKNASAWNWIHKKHNIAKEHGIEIHLWPHKRSITIQHIWPIFMLDNSW